MLDLLPFTAHMASAALLGKRSKRFSKISDPIMKLLEPLAHPEDFEGSVERAKASFHGWKVDGSIIESNGDHLFLYEIENARGIQRCLVGLVSSKAYSDGHIRRHEMTRTSRQKTLADYMKHTALNLTPVMLLHPHSDQLSEVKKRAISTPPLIDHLEQIGERHTVWQLNKEDEALVREAVRGIEAFYIADGHHRAAAAEHMASERGEDVQFSAAIFDAEELGIYTFHRLVKLSKTEAEAAKERVLEAFPNRLAQPNEFPQSQSEVVMAYGKERWMLTLPLIDYTLGVEALHAQILAPMLGILNPQEDSRIDFIPEVLTDGTPKLELDLRSQEIAFLPPRIPAELIIKLSDRNEVLPPKSTCFEPKVGTGLLIQCFAEANAEIPA